MRFKFRKKLDLIILRLRKKMRMIRKVHQRFVFMEKFQIEFSEYFLLLHLQ